MKLTEEQERLVLDNERLIHYLLQKKGVNEAHPDYKDLVSEGRIALQKAVFTFDKSKGNSFSTYASRCIYNAFGMYGRKNIKHNKVISLETPIGEGLTFADVIKDPDSDFTKNIENQEVVENIFSIIFNCLSKKDRDVMLYVLADKTQVEMADVLGVSQSVVSRRITRAINKIKQIAKSHADYKEVFSMAIAGENYKISFTSRDVVNFNKIFAAFMKNLTTTEGLPDFKVVCNKERIVIQVPAHQESFSFIAQIIEEIDDYSIAYVSGLEARENSKADFKATEQADLQESTKETETTEKTKPEEQPSHKKNDTVDVPRKKTENSGKRKKGKKYQVKEYLLKLESFTVQELQKAFPKFKQNDIANALHLAKQEGLITSIGRGAYKVNK